MTMTIVKRESGALPSTWLAASRTRNELGRIVLAFMLRDMRTRYGRSYISYLISIAWPLFHLLTMYGVYVLTHQIAPIGDDPSIFAFTGLAPYILCLYPARFTALAVIQNKPLLLFPIVAPLQLIFARVLLEALSAVAVFMLFFAGLVAFGAATPPPDIYSTSLVIAATIYFSLGLGVFGVILCSFHMLAGILFVVFFVLGLYLSSGAIIPLMFVPQTIKDALWYNPLFQAVALLRSAYYGGLGADVYSLSYIVLVGSVFLLLGLAGERLVRGRFLV